MEGTSSLMDHLTSSSTLMQNKMILIEDVIWQVAIKYMLDYCLRSMFCLMLFFIGSGFYYVFLYWLLTNYELRHFLQDPAEHFRSAKLPAASTPSPVAIRDHHPHHTLMPVATHFHVTPHCRAMPHPPRQPRLPQAPQGHIQIQGSHFALSALSAMA